MPALTTRDCIVVLGGVIAAAGLSWAGLAWLHGTMPDMSGMPADMVMPGMGSWTAAEVAWTFVM